MLFSLVWTAAVMGLMGGPHCLAMCAAPCAVVTSATAGAAGSVGVVQVQVQVQVPGRRSRLWQRSALFHAGRIAGYASLGALAAVAVQGLAWLNMRTTAMGPVWTFMHLAIMVWGILMMAQARQPAWIESAGRALWRRVQPVVAAPGGSFATGFVWALMPCGLLYSALLVAGLSGGALPGALSMAAFAIGSGLWLLAAPWLWGRLRGQLNALRADWGSRAAGLMLFGVAAWALWMDLVYKPSLWCR
ncbi:sulfite exporter TauE/SafE family protein [Pantoea sp. 18069]|uniref:sulfite exporter TauE/SafE family protein n=1 Tax=Pantoea sp. 18069 TaxID=2681415 RepID=UPI00135CEF51|nr:sulfite exporter TauE/SafE family protein [Pantoea sp. 18069]